MKKVLKRIYKILRRQGEIWTAKKERSGKETTK